MPLPRPVLDTRTFDQLVAEGRAQLPRLTRLHTDHNFSDPGMTLQELAAWLSEHNFYRFDRVTVEAQRAFLRLIGVSPRPAAVARTVVGIDSGRSSPVALPARMQLVDAAGGADFETVDALTVSPARIVHVLGGRTQLADCTQQNEAPYDRTRPEIGSFLPLGPRPHAGAALYLGFDRMPGEPGQRVSLYVWTTTPERDAATRVALIAEWATLRAEVKRTCPCTPAAAARVPDWRDHYWARTVWEYRRPSGRWTPLEGVVDETRALTLSGYVRFRAPDDPAAGGAGPHHYIRCRLVAGRYECAPRIDCLLANAVTVEHAVTIPREPLGTSRGHAAERYTAKHAPMVAGSTALEVVNAGSAEAGWREVPEWDGVGAHDRAYRLEPQTATLTLGNGLRGMPASAGAQLFLGYRRGSGPAGNVAARTLERFDGGAANAARVPAWQVIAPDLSVRQPVAAFGGAPAETLEAAKARAVEALAAVHKAVTLADFETLALCTPGVAVARARAIAETHPAVPCYRAAGSVTVVVIPECPGPHPVPSAAMLRAVREFLHPRRLVATEVHVAAPRYVRVTVHATLHADAGAERSDLARAARAAIDAYLHPLTGYDGRGWPAGRAVYRAEMMALLAALPGVACVTALGLQRKGDAAPRCGNVAICAGDLIAPGRHRIAVQSTRPGRLTRSVAHECECP